MKSFNEAVEYVMATGDKFSDHWAYTNELAHCERLTRSMQGALERMPECCPDCARKFVLSAMQAAFELGMATGMTMERNDDEIT